MLTFNNSQIDTAEYIVIKDRFVALQDLPEQHTVSEVTRAIRTKSESDENTYPDPNDPEHFHNRVAHRIDPGNYEESYEPTSETLFKAQVTKEQWVKDLTAARGVLREFRSTRKISKILNLNALPALADGEYRIIIFTSEFEKKKEATETVTLVKEEDEWKVIGYFIR